MQRKNLYIWVATIIDSMKNRIIFAASAFAMIFLLVPAAFAIDPPANQTITVDVEFLSSAQIIVVPSSLAWTGLTTGTAGGMKNLTVKNTGSVNVSQLYFFADTLDMELSRPYSSDNASSYSAGGVVVVKNESDGEFYYFAGRIEWNWTEDIPNKDLTSLNNPVGWGFFVNASSDYIWAVGNGTNATTNGPGVCNTTGAQLAIETDIDLGTVATRTPVTTSITRDSGDTNYSFFSVSNSNSPLFRHCVAVNSTCGSVYIYKYDKRTLPNFGSCANSRYLNAGNIVPSAMERLQVDVWVPRGLPAGNMTQTTLTFVASL